MNSPKSLTAAHQTSDRSAAPNKASNFAVFNNLNVRNFFVERDGVWYPTNSVIMDSNINNYLDQYRDLKLFYKDYVGEPLRSPFVTYPDMMNFYLFNLSI